MTLNDKKSYSENELEEFKFIILKKIQLNNNEISDMQHSLDKMETHNIGYSESALDSENQLMKINLKRLKKFNALLVNALKRIANKTYGICVSSGQLIPKERLKLVPHTTQRIEFKETENSNLYNNTNNELKLISNFESNFGYSNIFKNNIYLRKSKFGYYIQIGEYGEKINLNNRVSAYNLSEAENLFSNKPKNDTLIGIKDNNEIILKYGKYGYYISYNKRTFSVPLKLDHTKIDLNTAIEIINKKSKNTLQTINSIKSNDTNNRNLEIEKLIKCNKFIEASRLYKETTPLNWSKNKINEEFENLCESILSKSN